MDYPSLLQINGVDFTDIIAYESWIFTREGLQADGSGRNPYTGFMQFKTLYKPYYVQFDVVENADVDRVKALYIALWANEQVNSYRVYNIFMQEYLTFTGYMNKVSAGLRNFYFDESGNIIYNIMKFQIQVTEM